MAIQSICKIEDCGKRVVAASMCEPHYRRWKKYGDPNHRVRRPSGEALQYFHNIVMTYDGDECLVWPFTLHTWGYGQLWIDGKNEYVHTLICERVHGPRPTPEHEAAHSCGKGHLACVTKRHLGWKTPAGNTADKFRHGTVASGEGHICSKLTASQVRSIRTLKDLIPQSRVAELFGISQAHVANIQTGKRWAALS